MPWWGEVLVGIAIMVGILGTIVQVLPGGTLVGLAVAIWGAITGGQVGWTVAGIAVALVLLGYVLQFLIPGRHLKKSGVPGRSILIGGIFAVIGFFAIPVVGLFVGFIGGIFLSEFLRLRDVSAAWPSTVNALKAAGLMILVELTICLFITGTWIVGLFLT